MLENQDSGDQYDVFLRRLEKAAQIKQRETGGVAANFAAVSPPNRCKTSFSCHSGLSRSERRRKRRRSSIEPVIGHLKSDHRLDKCFLHCRIGDKLNLIGSAAGFNVRKLLVLMSLGIFSRAMFVGGVMWWFLLFLSRSLGDIVLSGFVLRRFFAVPMR